MIGRSGESKSLLNKVWHSPYQLSPGLPEAVSEECKVKKARALPGQRRSTETVGPGLCESSPAPPEVSSLEAPRLPSAPGPVHIPC